MRRGIVGVVGLVGGIGAGVIAVAGGAGCGRACCDGAASVAATAPLYEAMEAPAGVAAGTFDRTKVLVAYYGSERQKAVLAGMKRERNAALRRGDTARAQELERQGEAMQERAHRQLVGKEPLTEIGASLGDDMARIAKDAGVSVIVERGGEPAGSVTVDVTERLVERLAAAK